jgi:hypothetical protein
MSAAIAGWSDFDGVAVGTDLAGNADIMNSVFHFSYSYN